MNDSQQLREQMWDLIYGLLSPEETQPLVARIKSDPQAARLYAEVRLQADLVGYAAKIEDPSLNFQIEPAGGKTDKPAPARRSSEHSRTGRRIPVRTALAGIAATALAVLLAVGVCWPQPDTQKIARNYFITQVEGPASLPEGITTKITLKTYPVSFGDGLADEQAAGQPVDVEVQLVDAVEEVRFRQHVRTSAADGRAEIELPGEAIEPGVRLKVAAARQLSESEASDPPDDESAAPGNERRGELYKQQSTPALTAALPVEPEPLDSYFVLESPPAAEGAPFNFYALKFKAFSRELVPADPAQITVDNAAGVAIAEPIWSVDPGSGVVRGNVQLPPDTAAQDLTVRMRESSGTQSQAQLAQLLADQRAFGYRHGITGEQAASPQNSLAADEQRAERERLVERKQDGQPQAARPPAPAAQSPGQNGVAESRYYEQGVDRAQGLNELAAVGRAAGGETPADPIALPAASAGRSVWVPIPHQVPAGARDLVAVAFCRGVNVASAPVVMEQRSAKDAARADAQEQAERTFSLDLPPEADGEVEVTLIDRSSNPPQVVERRVLYREPTRKLNISLAEGRQQFAAGEPARLTLQFSDENGQPVAGANVVVRLWNEDVVRRLAQRPATLDDLARGRARSVALGVADQAALGTVLGGAPGAAGGRGKGLSKQESRQSLARAGEQEVQSAEAAPEAAKYQFSRRSGVRYSDSGSGSDFAEVGPAWGYSVVTPPQTMLLASTREQVEAQVAAAIRAAQSERRGIVRAIYFTVLGGAVVLLASLGVVGLRRMPARRRLLIPALAIAASLVIGILWIGRPPWVQQIALAPAIQPPPASTAVPSEEAIPPAKAMPPATSAEGGASSEYSVALGNAPESPLADAAGMPAPTATGSAPASDLAALPSAAAILAESTKTPLAAPTTAPAAAVPAKSLARNLRPTGEVASTPPAPVPSGPAPSLGPVAGGGQGEVDTLKAALRDAPRGSQTAQSRLSLEKAGAEGAKTFANKPEALAESLAMKKETTDKEAGSLEGVPSGGTIKGSALAGEATRPFQSPSGGFGGGQGAGGFAGGGLSADGATAGAGKNFGLAPGTLRGGSGGSADSGALSRGGGLQPPAAEPLTALGGESKPAEEGERLNRGATQAPPPALYFNPQLVSDASGRVTINFTMPQGETAYRLLVDALGKGRIGSAQEVIVGSPEQAAAPVPATAPVLPASSIPK